MRHHKNSRNPRGLSEKGHIALRLMPAELEDANRISLKMGVSKSRLARDAYLAGLPLVISGDSYAAANSPAASFGGEAQASPATFSAEQNTAR